MTAELKNYYLSSRIQQLRRQSGRASASGAVDSGLIPTRVTLITL